MKLVRKILALGDHEDALAWGFMLSWIMMLAAIFGAMLFGGPN